MSENEILEITQEILGLTAGKIDLNIPIKDLPNWDSIKNLMLLNSIEESKNFQFTDNQLESIVSLRDISNIVVKENE